MRNAQEFETVMNAWSVQDAKTNFSVLLRASAQQGPQMITKRGRPAAVLVSIGQWNSIEVCRPRNLKQILLDPAGPRDFHLPPRGRLKLRSLSERTV